MNTLILALALAAPCLTPATVHHKHHARLVPVASPVPVQACAAVPIPEPEPELIEMPYVYVKYVTVPADQWACFPEVPADAPPVPISEDAPPVVVPDVAMPSAPGAGPGMVGILPSPGGGLISEPAPPPVAPPGSGSSGGPVDIGGGGLIGGIAAPEIDPASGGSALTLLAGVLILAVRKTVTQSAVRLG